MTQEMKIRRTSNPLYKIHPPLPEDHPFGTNPMYADERIAGLDAEYFDRMYGPGHRVVPLSYSTEETWVLKDVKRVAP